MTYLPEFPTCLRPFGPELIERISAASAHPILGTVRSSVRGEAFAYPRRIYCRPSLPAVAAQYADDARLLTQAMGTRHWDGRVREHCLHGILTADRDWIAPFVVQLLGEYVLEIAEAILAAKDRLDPSIYAAFAGENPQFMATTERRVVSYWNCYFRERYRDREDYPAMIALRAIQQMGVATIGPRR